MRPIPSRFPAILLLGSLALAGLAFAPAPAAAQKPTAAKPAAKPAATPAPKAIGTFDDWQAATHVEAGQTVCYAFTRAQGSTPAQPGRGDVVLTVTQRPSVRDAVALSAGFEYAANAAVAVQIDKDTQEFYTAKRSAFARDGHATVALFQKASKVQTQSPGPRNAVITDNFSLRGFSKAYDAINKACPAK
jgi:hypothetical protein